VRESVFGEADDGIADYLKLNRRIDSANFVVGGKRYVHVLLRGLFY